MTTEDLNIGDNITITDHHTSLGVPISWPYYVQGIDGDYYIVRKRDLTSRSERLPKSYPHYKKEIR